MRLDLDDINGLSVTCSQLKLREKNYATLFKGCLAKAVSLNEEIVLTRQKKASRQLSTNYFLVVNL